MKAKNIKISWFRGSSNSIDLILDFKSVVIYGENGSGKSSFIDAIEYIINNGKINHLAHEYSGRKQEKAILNTHTPTNEKGLIAVELEDKKLINVEILKNGNFTISPEENPIKYWDYRCSVLRQNELADFITDSKGGKYSAILPLLGLEHLEILAQNLRNILKNIKVIGEIDLKKGMLLEIDEGRKRIFKEKTGPEIIEELKSIYSLYCKEKLSEDSSNNDILKKAIEGLNIKVKQNTFDIQKYNYLSTISKIDIPKLIEDVGSSALKLSSSAEPLIAEKLNVLKFSKLYSDKNTKEVFDCPACGREISAELFEKHLENENKELSESLLNFNSYKENINILAENIKEIKNTINQNILKEWVSQQNQENIKYVNGLNVEKIKDSFTDENKKEIENNLIPLIDSVKKENVNIPPDASVLITNQGKLDIISRLLRFNSIKKEIDRIENIINFISDIEKGYREQIRIQSSSIIAEISSDVARMWSILHPEEKIEDIKLCLPENIDKAVEIGLKFYGVEQDSPRLTLSEGHRNSLGLCIFLSMAKRENKGPIFLDDIVVSFDRKHRGMIAELLAKEFLDRQIIIFTHERSWYFDLKRQLDQSKWNFKTLKPWESPDVGIRFSHVPYSFDDARALLLTNPSSAGNMARTIVDEIMQGLGESLEIELPFLKGEKNDTRTGHEFLEKIISLNSFYIKQADGSYITFKDAIEDIKQADGKIISWGNRASHTFDVEKNEASSLINESEKAISRFSCDSCKNSIDSLNDKKGRFCQCSCGNIKWKY